MPSIIYDYTRVISALGQSPGRPYLILSDLAKLVEAIVLYDSIYTTENIPSHYLRTGAIGEGGFFDLGKSHIYEPVFTSIFKEIPPEVDARVGMEHINLPRARYRGLNILRADLAVLQQAKSAVSNEDFQLLSETDFSEESLLRTLERIRILTSIAGELGVPYDPISFRVPLLSVSIPGNLSEEHVGPYRQFERGVQAYIEEVLHGKLGFQIPLMLAIVLRECQPGSPDDVFAIALQLRNDPMVVRLRELLEEHIRAFGDLDFEALAKTDRVVKSELARLKSQLSGELPSEFKLSLKPGWVPLTVGWEIKSTLQRFRDGKRHLPLANLARLTKETLRVLGQVRSNLSSVLPLELRE